MTVLHIITGLDKGGAESALYRLVTYSPNKLNHIVISLVDNGYFKAKLTSQNICVYELGMKRGRIGLLCFFKLNAIVNKIKPDIIQTWMYHSDLIGGIVAKFNHIPVVWGIHNFNLDKNAASLSSRITAKICAFLSFWIPSKVITCSQSSILTHKNYGYNASKFITIPLGYDFNELRHITNARQFFFEKYDLHNESFLFGCLARWDPQKDHKNLLTSFSILCKEYNNVYCALFGIDMNEQNSKLMDLISELKIDKSKLILGGITHSVPEIMSALDIHVLASVGEAFPNVVAEAMACETLTIVTDVGDSSFICDNLGWVVPSRNSTALLNAMKDSIELKNNKLLWNKRRKESRFSILRRFDLSIMSNNYFSVWNDVILNKSSNS